MVSTRVILAAAVLALAVFVAVIQAQEKWVYMECHSDVRLSIDWWIDCSCNLQSVVAIRFNTQNGQSDTQLYVYYCIINFNK